MKKEQYFCDNKDCGKEMDSKTATMNRIEKLVKANDFVGNQMFEIIFCDEHYNQFEKSLPTTLWKN